MAQYNDFISGLAGGFTQGKLYQRERADNMAQDATRNQQWQQSFDLQRERFEWDKVKQQAEQGDQYAQQAYKLYVTAASDGRLAPQIEPLYANLRTQAGQQGRWLPERLAPGKPDMGQQAVDNMKVYGQAQGLGDQGTPFWQQYLQGTGQVQGPIPSGNVYDVQTRLPMQVQPPAPEKRTPDQAWRAYNSGLLRLQQAYAQQAGPEALAAIEAGVRAAYRDATGEDLPPGPLNMGDMTAYQQGSLGLREQGLGFDVMRDAANRGLGQGNPYFDEGAKRFMGQQVAPMPIQPLPDVGGLTSRPPNFGNIPARTVAQVADDARADARQTQAATTTQAKTKVRISENNTPSEAAKLRALGFKPYVAGLHAKRVVNSLVERGYLASTGGAYTAKNVNAPMPGYVRHMIEDTNKQYNPDGTPSGYKGTPYKQPSSKVNYQAKIMAAISKNPSLRPKVEKAKKNGYSDREIYEGLQ